MFQWEPLLGKQIHLSQSSNLSTQTTLNLKTWRQRDRDYLKNCCKRKSSTPLLRIQAITIESKFSKNHFLDFY